MTVRRIMGIETEYGVLQPGRPLANPMLLSSHVVAVHAFEDVRDKDVGVQLRIAGARRAVPERGGNQAVTLDRDRPAVFPSPTSRHALQVSERIGDRFVVSDPDRPP